MTDWDNLEGEARCPRHRQGVGGAVVSPGDKLWSLRDVVAGWPGVDVWIFLEDEPPILWGGE